MSTKSSMRRQIESIPEMMRTIYPALDHQVRMALTHTDLFALKKLYFTGCGDSYCAAAVGARLMTQLGGLASSACSSIDAARYMSAEELHGPADSVAMLGISALGNVTRVAEAMKRTQVHGGLTIALTANPKGIVAQNASRIVLAQTPPFDFSPGVRSYCCNLMALTLLAIRVGEVRGKLNPRQADTLRQMLCALPDQIERTMPQMLEVAQTQALRLKDMQMFEFIGCADAYDTAAFAAFKIMECTGAFTTHCNTEDWFHTQYFFKDISHTASCLITNSTSPAADREKTFLEEARIMGRKVWIISDRVDCAQAEIVPMPLPGHGCLRPLVQYLPAAAVASELCDLKQEQYMRGGTGHWTNCADCALITGGEMIIL